MKVQIKKVNALFFVTDSGKEPVREVLKNLGRPAKTQIGEDIRFVEVNWRVDRPYVDRLRSGKGEYEKTLYEVRHTVENIEYRTLFFIYENKMVLVHLFQKKAQRAPQRELILGWDRMKQWIREQKTKETT